MFGKHKSKYVVVHILNAVFKSTTWLKTILICQVATDVF